MKLFIRDLLSIVAAVAIGGFIGCHTASADPSDVVHRIAIEVVEKDAKGGYTHRTGEIQGFSDGKVIVCMRSVGDEGAKVACLVQLKGSNIVLLVHVLLIGEMTS